MENRYFSLPDDDQGLSILFKEHPEVKTLYERRDRYPAFLSINGVNPIFHVQMEAIIENQLHDANLLGVREVFEKLQEEGFTSHAAKASIAQVFLVDFHAMLNDKKTFDTEAYVRRLGLIGHDFSKLKRNDRCLCGSGAKFKRCCAPYAESFVTSPLLGRLHLGYGSYLLEDPQDISDPLDPIFQLEARYHISDYMERFKDLEGALEMLQENVLVAQTYQKGRFLENAWEDVLLLCKNHPELSEKGLEAFDILIALTDDKQEKGKLLCDKADFLAPAFNIEATKTEYAFIFKMFPDFHFGRYRYAQFLNDHDRGNEAKIVLQDLLSNNLIDKETRIEATALLEELEADEEIIKDIEDFLVDFDQNS